MNASPCSLSLLCTENLSLMSCEGLTVNVIIPAGTKQDAKLPVAVVSFEPL